MINRGMPMRTYLSSRKTIQIMALFLPSISMLLKGFINDDATKKNIGLYLAVINAVILCIDFNLSRRDAVPPTSPPNSSFSPPHQKPGHASHAA